MSKTLSICIPVFNKFGFTKSCLNDLSKLPNDHEIIVVDNASSDETESQLKNSSEITYIRNDKNEGFAKACNKAYSQATAPNVLFLNNDIRVKENHNNWTQELIKHCPDSLVGPTMGQLAYNFSFVKEANQYLDGLSYMSGWCLAASKEIWQKLIIPNTNNQVFSEEFFCYFEDTDLSFRARELQIPFKVVDIPVVHFGRISSNQLNTQQLYTSAKQIFFNKWAPRLRKRLHKS
jgi:hypothetical protein